MLVDTREPDPRPWERNLPEGWRFDRGTLETGDIALAPAESQQAGGERKCRAGAAYTCRAPAESIPTDAARPELAQVVLAQAAELGTATRLSGERNAPRACLPRPPHPSRGALGRAGHPHGVDRDVVRRLSTKCSSPRSFSTRTSTRKRRREQIAPLIVQTPLKACPPRASWATPRLRTPRS